MLSHHFFSRKRALEGASDKFVGVAFCKTDESIERATIALRQLTSLAGDKGDYDNDNKESVDIVIGMEAVADALVVDEDVVVNQMGR